MYSPLTRSTISRPHLFKTEASTSTLQDPLQTSPLQASTSSLQHTRNKPRPYCHYNCKALRKTQIYNSKAKIQQQSSTQDERYDPGPDISSSCHLHSAGVVQWFSSREPSPRSEAPSSLHWKYVIGQIYSYRVHRTLPPFADRFFNDAHNISNWPICWTYLSNYPIPRSLTKSPPQKCYQVCTRICTRSQTTRSWLRSFSSLQNPPNWGLSWGKG